MKSFVKQICHKYKFKPKKRLGQNFLIDKNVIKKVVSVAEISDKDIILEIGPGTGNITKELAKKAKQVIAIEKDPKMCEILKKELSDFKNIEIFQKDILKTTNYKLQTTNYKVVGNLPFHLVLPVIRKFLEMIEVRPQSLQQMVLIVQKEIAQKIVAKPPKMNLLSVLVQFYAQARIISCISAESFWPKPKVGAAIIKITPRKSRVSVSQQFREQFFRIVKAGFSQPRKQLINCLSAGLKLEQKIVREILEKSKIDPKARAETLTISDWLKISKSSEVQPRKIRNNISDEV